MTILNIGVHSVTSHNRKRALILFTEREFLSIFMRLQIIT